MKVYSLENSDGYGYEKHFGVYSSMENAERAEKYYKEGYIVEHEVDKNLELFDKREYTLEIFKDNKIHECWDTPIEDSKAKETIHYGYNQLMNSTQHYLIVQGIIANSKEEALARAISLREKIEATKPWPKDAKKVKTQPTSLRDL